MAPAGSRGAAGSSASLAFPGASSTSFGASLFAMTSGGGRDAAVGGAAGGRGGGGSRAAAMADVGAGGGERPHEDVMTVVEQVRAAQRAGVGERVRCTRGLFVHGWTR